MKTSSILVYHTFLHLQLELAPVNNDSYSSLKEREMKGEREEESEKKRGKEKEGEGERQKKLQNLLMITLKSVEN